VLDPGLGALVYLLLLLLLLLLVLLFAFLASAFCLFPLRRHNPLPFAFCMFYPFAFAIAWPFAFWPFAFRLCGTPVLYLFAFFGLNNFSTIFQNKIDLVSLQK